MDRGTLLLIALALIALAGVVLGVSGISLFRRDRVAATEDDAEASREELSVEGSA
jgi:hypothetical protein